MLFAKTPEQDKFRKAVEQKFILSDWKTDRSSTTTQDFVASCGKLRFSVKCIDDAIGNFRSPTAIIEFFEQDFRYHRYNLQRQLIVILDRNFLSVSLESLLDRNLFVITAEDVAEVLELAPISNGALPNGLPSTLSSRQKFLLESSVDYMLTVASGFLKSGDRDQAIKYGEMAVKNIDGLTSAHLNLFSLYRDAKEFDRADKLAEVLSTSRGDDPRVIKLLFEYYKLRGNQAETEKWQEKIASNVSAPRTFEDILAKQRYESPTEKILIQTKTATENKTNRLGNESPGSGLGAKIAKLISKSFGR